MAQEQKTKYKQISVGGLGRPFTVFFTVFCCWIFTCLSTTDAQEMSDSLKALRMEESYPQPSVKIMRGSPPLSVLLRMRDRADGFKKANTKIKFITERKSLTPAGSDVIQFQNEVLKEKEMQIVTVRPVGPGGVIGPSGPVRPPVGPVFPHGPIGSVRPIDSVKSVEKVGSIGPSGLIGPSGPILGPVRPVFPGGPIGPIRSIDPVKSVENGGQIGPSGPVLRPEGPVFPGGPIGPIRLIGTAGLTQEAEELNIPE